MTTNSLNALMVGSVDDAVWLGAHSAATETAVRAIQAFDTTPPAPLTDRGWLSEDGASLEMNDSADKLRGHQGHGTVMQYMSESDTSFKCSFLETQLATLVESMDISQGALVGTGEAAVAILDVPSSRKSRLLSGVVDLYNVAGIDAQFRFLFPRLSMGERASMTFKVEEAVGYEYNLEILDGFRLITNAPGVVGDSAAFADLLEVLELTPVGP